MSDTLNRKALLSGIWYTVSNFLVRGASFISTPIFTRLMTEKDYGYFSNYSSWLSLLAILTTLDLYTSVRHAVYDFKDDLDGYLSSILLFGTGVTAICYLCTIFWSDFFRGLFNLRMEHIHIVFISILVSPALDILRAKSLYQMKYKVVTALSLSATFLSTTLAVILVLVMRDRLTGRIFGQFSTLFLLNLAIYVYLLCRGRKFIWTYCMHAAKISIPYIPHILSSNILASTDKILITRYWGTEYTALYSVLYSCSSILLVLFSALNQAVSPWLFANLKENRYESIRRATNVLVVGGCLFCIPLMLLAPEVVLLMGGEKYTSGLHIMAPIMLGSVFFFLYTFYVNVELYHKKTLGISSKTIIAALFNLIANIAFIPILGYEAAAYTTLIGYVILFTLHCRAAQKLGIEEYYNNKLIVTAAILMTIVFFMINFIMSYSVIRYAVIVIMAAAFAIFFLRKKKDLIALLKR